ncbi:MAG: hypothetical protein WKF73_21500 [Nocardioidaceae bacterium]
MGLLTSAEVDELDRYQGGEGVIVLARAGGVHRSTVVVHLDRCGVRRRLWSGEQVHRAGRLYARGLMLAEMAVDLGTRQRTVGRAVARLGAPRRPAGPGPKRH